MTRNSLQKRKNVFGGSMAATYCDRRPARRVCACPLPVLLLCTSPRELRSCAAAYCCASFACLPPPFGFAGGRRVGFLAGARGRMPGSRGIRMLEFAVSKDAHVFGACGLFKFVGAARLLPHLQSLLLDPSTYLWKPAGFWQQRRDQVDSCRTISWRIVI